MRLVLSTLLVAALGCSSASPPQAKKRTLPEPLVAAELPPKPDEEQKVPPAADWAVAADGYFVEGDGSSQELTAKPGICMSMEKGLRAARYVVRYQELRGLYEIDLRTWGRERSIYERHLELAQQETDAWKKEAERSWLERNAGPLGLTIGVVVGVTAAVAGTAAIKAAAE